MSSLSSASNDWNSHLNFAEGVNFSGEKFCCADERWVFLSEALKEKADTELQLFLYKTPH